MLPLSVRVTAGSTSAAAGWQTRRRPSPGGGWSTRPASWQEICWSVSSICLAENSGWIVKQDGDLVLPSELSVAGPPVCPLTAVKEFNTGRTGNSGW